MYSDVYGKIIHVSFNLQKDAEWGVFVPNNTTQTFGNEVGVNGEVGKATH